MAQLINFYGAPSSGKSTIAAELFCKMKKAGKDVELVSEHAKDWVWDKRKIEKFFQIKIVSEQIYRESRLFDQVEYIITDSPAIFGCFYEEYYFKQEIIRPMMKLYLEERNKHVRCHDYFLKYIPEKATEKGRFQSKQESIEIDQMLPAWLKVFGINTIEWNENLIEKFIS